MNNIILTGFMGCGKSSIGKKLSYKVQMTLLDTDKQIEKEQGRSVSEIFEQDGEEFFRDLETECLQKLLEEGTSQVVAVGGGMPLREENRRLLHRLGTVIYLKVSPETILERLQNDNTRPLLREDASLAEISHLLGQREAVYESTAHIVISADEKEMDSILNKIKEAVEQYAAGNKRT